MTRRWLWLELIVGWLPIWALFTAMIAMAHGTSITIGAMIALRTVITAGLLGLLVRRLPDRLPWPHPFRVSFAAIQFIAAFAYSSAWILLNSAYESLRHGELLLDIGPGLGPTFIMGVWMYVMIAGVAYTAKAAERAARAETLAANARLAALRGQLHPHFLFNALHTVIQLIPTRPADAAATAEQLAGLLRTATEEDRDLVDLGDEMAFVNKYLAIEHVRFGDRLTVKQQIADDTLDAQLPSFAIQTLVENAVRHAAAPRIERSTITINGSLNGNDLLIVVADDGAGADAAAVATSSGSGLKRLRERLAALYGGAARLDIVTSPGNGFTATIRIPQSRPT